MYYLFVPKIYSFYLHRPMTLIL